LEHLCDVDEVGPGFTRRQRLRDPRDREVHRAVGQRLLRHDVDAPFDQLHLEALVGVEPLVLRRVVPGELGLDVPLHLEADLVDGAAVAAAFPAATTPVTVVVTTGRRDERHRQQAGGEDHLSPLHARLLPRRGRASRRCFRAAMRHHAPTGSTALIPPGTANRSRTSAAR
jgi:hypothetical protein